VRPAGRRIPGKAALTLALILMNASRPMPILPSTACPHPANLPGLLKRYIPT
jgi:hypothetical protein